jgi:hypothetical protein
VADGLAHPGVDGRRAGILELDVAHGARILIGEDHRLVALKNLKWVGHVVCPRDTGQKTLDLGIAFKPMRLVVFPDGQSFRCVGNRAALDDAETRRHRTHGAHRDNLFGGHRAEGPGPEGKGSARSVGFDIPVGAVHGLPYAIQVRMRVSQRSITFALSRTRLLSRQHKRRQPEQRHQRQSVLHRIAPRFDDKNMGCLH